MKSLIKLVESLSLNVAKKTTQDMIKWKSTYNRISGEIESIGGDKSHQLWKCEPLKR